MTVGTSPAEWVRPRLWLVTSALAAGAVVGPLAVAALSIVGDDTLFGTRKAFALGTLALGFGAGVMVGVSALEATFL